MLLTQDESVELCMVLALSDDETLWLELMAAGACAPPERPLIPAVRFDLFKHGDVNAVLDFRFDIAGVCLLSELFALPTTIITDNHDRCTKEEGFSILLHRLSFPRRLHDMTRTFGRSRSSMCRIFSLAWQTLYAPTQVVRTQINSCCDAVANKTAVRNVFAFSDGTKLQICRPSARKRKDRQNLQYQVYSGHKRCHCLIFQGLTAPNGLCISFWGPYEGRRHDTTVFGASKILEYFEPNADIFEGKAIFGDPAYSISKYVVAGFKQAVVSIHQQIFNKEMSTVRIAVEWKIGIMERL